MRTLLVIKLMLFIAKRLDRLFKMFIIILLCVFVIQINGEYHQYNKNNSSEFIKTSGRPWKWPESKTINEQSFIFHLLKHKFKVHMIEKIPTTQMTPVPIDCICVPYYQCNVNNTLITDGIGVIDVRIRQCTGDLEVCCKLPPPTTKPERMEQIVTPTNIPTIIFTNPPTMAPTTTTMAPTTTTTTTTTMAPTTTTTTMAPTTTTRPPIITTTNLPLIQPVPSNCVCVPASQCDMNGVVIISGAGVINPRQSFNPCTESGQVCCRLPTTGINFPTVIIPSPSPAPTQIIIPSTQPPSTTNCVCVSLIQCDKNGFVIVSGAGNIDPRLPSGRQTFTSCLTGQICCKLPQNGQDSDATSTNTFQQLLPTLPVPSIDPRSNVTGVKKNIGTPNECTCVEPSICQDGFVVTSFGGDNILTGIIDSRFGPCRSASAVCCRSSGIIGNNKPTIGSPLATVTVVTSAVNLNLYPNNQVNGFCGVKGPACTGGSFCAANYGETYFAEFPWMVALLIRQTGGDAVFRCGGSMLNTRAVLTAAHCVTDRPAGVLVARFGEWNTANNDEPLPFQESDVESIITHPQYYSPGLYYDVAVLILSTPVSYTPNIQPICLPPPGMTFPPGQQCVASGWGRSGFEGKYQTILKKIDLPMVEKNECQTRLQTTKLGPYFQLHKTFLCAGGELSKDTCTGDGGGPLVCLTSTGQFMQAGIVSWGIGCGSNNIPAVYTDVSQQRGWIDQQLANYGVS